MKDSCLSLMEKGGVSFSKTIRKYYGRVGQWKGTGLIVFW